MSATEGDEAAPETAATTTEEEETPQTGNCRDDLKVQSYLDNRMFGYRNAKNAFLKTEHFDNRTKCLVIEVIGSVIEVLYLDNRTTSCSVIEFPSIIDVRLSRYYCI